MTSTSSPHPDLLEHEIWWRQLYNFFQENGYALRSRYHPDWVPSWTGTDKGPEHCEDGARLPVHRRHLLDARRARDGTCVLLKHIDVSQNPYEVVIGRYLCTSPLIQDPANHWVPIYDILKVPDGDNHLILVMPQLRDAKEPSFDTVGEVIDCVHQLLEGMQFMHRHRVAHRNHTQLDILMDGSMFVNAWHPLDESMSEDLTHQARYRTRTLSPPRYYYADFGVPSETRLFGEEKSAPEFKKGSTKPWNTFATDVWCLGHAIQHIFLNHYSGVKFLNSLVSDMMHTDPAQRPNMDVVVSRFKDLRQGLSTRKLRSQVVHVNKMYLFGFIPHWIRRIQYIVRDIPPTRTAILY